jgi:hypothetical protein
MSNEHDSSDEYERPRIVDRTVIDVPLIGTSAVVCAAFSNSG